MELPGDLQMALDQELAGISAKALAKVVADLSNRYRSGPPASRVELFHSREEVAAYAASRLPATYAAVYAALSQVQEQLPDWQPETFLDIGAGPGTAMWPATEMWPTLQRITLLDRDENMIALGKKLARYSPMPAIKKAAWQVADLTKTWSLSPHHLVIAAYVLGWLTEEDRAKLIQKLWQITNGALVIIEPGTPAGFLRIKEAREQLLAAGAKTIAPCPHNNPCPMSGGDWCHFAQRVARSRLHRQVKGGDLSYEDEKFSYLGMSTMQAEPIAGRIIRHPHIQKGAVQFEVCAPEGLRSTVVTRKDREAFRKARQLRWGSVLPASDEETPEL